MKNFTSFSDVDDLNEWIELALKFKASPLLHDKIGKGKTLGLLFFNPSLRTRMSTQKAAYNLGMDVITMNLNNDGWQIEINDGTVMNSSAQEHIKDAVKVMSQYCDIIGVRTFANFSNKLEDYEEKVLSKFIEHATVPVISLESATLHPLQSLTDTITITENTKKKKPKVVLSWAPHPKALPQAVANSFVQWVKNLDVELVVTQPEGLELNAGFTGGVQVTSNQIEALKGADFVYAKNWSSYHNYGAIGDFKKWKITTQKMKLTNNAHFMHCLPIRRNVVADDKVLDDSSSLIYEQANNRTYAAQAALFKLLTQ